MNTNYCRIEYIIAIDFDGTIVTHDYPRIGQPVPYAKEVINMLAENGHKCFLWTMRDNNTLEDAKKYCENNDIKIQCYNQSPAQFSNSPKQYAVIYIDDAALGCPTSYEHGLSSRPFVDWYKVAEMLINRYPCSITAEQFKSLIK